MFKRCMFQHNIFATKDYLSSCKNSLQGASGMKRLDFLLFHARSDIFEKNSSYTVKFVKRFERDY